MNQDNKLVQELAPLVGEGNISDSIFERVSYAQDALSPDIEPGKIPHVVVKPVSTRDVSRVLQYANREKIPVYVHGAGTAFKGSPRPKRPGSILLSTQGLVDLELHEEDMYFEAGAGANQYELEKQLKGRGYMLPMNIGSKFSSTIGGAVAINTIGHMVDICLGKIIDHVMGLEVVLPDGEIIETGTRSIRRPAGIDYNRFFAGMEGLFGVITRVRIRLLPELKRGYVVGFFPELRDIAHGFMRLYREKLPPPLYGELLDKSACRAPFMLRGLGEPPGHMGLAITVGHRQEEADQRAQEIVDVFLAEKAVEARVVDSPQEQEDYWAARDNILNILQTPEGEENLLLAGAVETAVPLSRLADVIDFLGGGHGREALKEAKLFIYGHVGTCDLHGLWVTPASYPPEKRMECIREARLLEGEINMKWGCASGEIGQTASRIPFLKERYGGAAYRMLMNFKRTIDPNNILNPGNLEGEGYV